MTRQATLENPYFQSRIAFIEATRDIEFCNKFYSSYLNCACLAILDPQAPKNILDAQKAFLTEATPALHPKTRLVLFTSGSGGQKKAVQLSAENIEANTSAVIHSLEMERVSEQFLFLPLHYSFGLLGQLLPAMRLGIKTHFLQNFLEMKTLAEAGKLRGMVSAVGSQWDVLAPLLAPSAPLTQVTHVVSAGSRLSRGTRLRLRELFPEAVIFNNYGQTEASPRILSMSSRHPDFYSDYTGFPVGEWKVELTSTGELQAQGPQFMLGYVGEPARDPSAWLLTGDQAEMRDDGLVTILGRRDDLIKFGGERASLVELADQIREIAQADEACGVSYTDSQQIDRWAIFIANARVERPEVLALIRKQLKGPWYPQRIEWTTQALPKLPNGKVDRMALREALKNV